MHSIVRLLMQLFTGEGNVHDWYESLIVMCVTCLTFTGEGNVYDQYKSLIVMCVTYLTFTGEGNVYDLYESLMVMCITRLTFTGEGNTRDLYESLIVMCVTCLTKSCRGVHTLLLLVETYTTFFSLPMVWPSSVWYTQFWRGQTQLL